MRVGWWAIFEGPAQVSGLGMVLGKIRIEELPPNVATEKEEVTRVAVTRCQREKETLIDLAYNEMDEYTLLESIFAAGRKYGLDEVSRLEELNSP